MFHPFLDDTDVEIHGVEAAGEGIDTTHHAATISKGSPGVLHGARSYLLQDRDGQINEAHSISAGLDYPGVGPEHSWLKDQGRVQYVLGDRQGSARCLRVLLSKLEGIIPAQRRTPRTRSPMLCSVAPQMKAKDEIVAICLSGRCSDKDVFSAAAALERENMNFGETSPSVRASRARLTPPPQAGEKRRAATGIHPSVVSRKTLAELKRENRAAFIPFVTAGDPDHATSLAILEQLPAAGADIIELGIPFSDPMASDGPVNQASYLRALAAGMQRSSRRSRW